MLTNRLKLVPLAALLLLSIPGAAQDGGGSAPISLTLNNSFITLLRNRATIEGVEFLVDQAHDKANSPSKDGDLHVAGRSPSSVGLPMVAELMNAKKHKNLVKAVNDAEGLPDPLIVSGVWRVWPEHAGLDAQVQGDPVAPSPTTNPEHLFEIHPITQVGDTSVLNTLTKISGYKYKDADDAFQRYEGSTFAMECGETTTTLRMRMLGYNYVDFTIELLEDPTHFTQDGLSLFAMILEPEDEEISINGAMQRRRM